MSFTPGEFVRGVALAPAFTLALVPISAAVFMPLATKAAPQIPTLEQIGLLLGSGLLYALFAVPWAIAATIGSGAPLAYLLGCALRHRPSIREHLLAFAALGGAVGLATVIVVGMSIAPQAADSPIEYAMGLSIWFVPPSIVGVALAWWLTATLALRTDARQARAVRS